MKIFLMLVFLFLAIISIKTVFNRSFKDYNLINLAKIEDLSIVVAKKDSIEFRFILQKNTNLSKLNQLRLTAFSDSTIFDIKIGQNIDSIPFFKNSSKLSLDSNGKYSRLSINNYFHHSIFFNLENTKQRVANYIDSDSSVILLGWTFGSIYYKDQLIEVEHMNNSKIFICTFIDKNLDNIIDKGELKRITLVFSNLTGRIE